MSVETSKRDSYITIFTRLVGVRLIKTRVPRTTAISSVTCMHKVKIREVGIR